MDDCGFGRKPFDIARNAVVESETRPDDEVRVRDGAVCRDGTVHPRHPEGVFGPRRIRAQSHQRGDDRNAGAFGESGDLGGRRLTAATDHHDRVTGRAYRFSRTFDLARVTDGGGFVAGQLEHRLERSGKFSLLHVFRHVDQDRPRTPRRGDMKRLTHHLGDVVDLFNQVVVLGNRQRDAVHVGFLKSVGADQRRGHVAGDGDHRRRVHVRGRQPVTRFVAPGPEVAKQTPTRPEAR